MTKDDKDTMWFTTDFSYYAENMKDWCENCDPVLEIPEENSKEYWDLISHMRDCEQGDFFSNLKYSKWSDADCIISGTLGLWNGHPDIEPVMVNGLKEAIERCIGRDTWDLSVGLKDGVVWVNSYHHDGCNRFYIRPLRPKFAEKVATYLTYGDNKVDLSQDKYYEKIDYMF